MYVLRKQNKRNFRPYQSIKSSKGFSTNWKSCQTTDKSKLVSLKKSLQESLRKQKMITMLGKRNLMLTQTSWKQCTKTNYLSVRRSFPVRLKYSARLLDFSKKMWSRIEYKWNKSQHCWESLELTISMLIHLELLISLKSVMILLIIMIQDNFTEML